MSKHTFSIVEHHGGMATDLKQGVPESFAYCRHLDFRKRPTGLTILPKGVKETGTTVTGLITEMIQLPSGKMVAIDDAGGVYVRTTGASWSKDGTTLPDTAAGMLYNLQQDTIYIPGLHNVHSITNADGRFAGGVFTVNANAISRNVDQSATGSANTYTTTGAVNEGATHKLSVTPTVEPMYSIKIWVTTKGTGDLIITMHDAANNVLATVTIPNASLVNGALNEFVFTTPVRNTVRPGASTYHFHIHHPSGTASTIGTSVASDFSGARFETWANRLVDPINNLHPAVQFLQYMLIGNERYVTAWEIISQSAPSNTEFQRHRLVLEPGYEVTSMAKWDESIAVAAEKRSSSATNEFQEGRIYFWNAIDAGWNRAIDVPEGAPYSLMSHKNVLYWFAGGAWWAWAGGLPVKLFQMPNTDFEFTDAATYMFNNPHMMAVRNGILLGGFPTETNSNQIEYGLYSFGARNKNYNESFGYSYSISTGNRTNGTLRIGLVKSFGDKLFYSWRDDTAYGVDKVDPNSDPFGTATWESLIMDFGRPDKQKLAITLFITFKTLPTGATVTPKYKIDRETNWNNDDDAIIAVAGATTVRLSINKRFRELQLALDLVATTVTPEIISINLTIETLVQEQD